MNCFTKMKVSFRDCLLWQAKPIESTISRVLAWRKRMSFFNYDKSHFLLLVLLWYLRLAFSVYLIFPSLSAVSTKKSHFCLNKRCLHHFVKLECFDSLLSLSLSLSKGACVGVCLFLLLVFVLLQTQPWKE